MAAGDLSSGCANPFLNSDDNGSRAAPSGQPDHNETGDTDEDSGHPWSNTDVHATLLAVGDTISPDANDILLDMSRTTWKFRYPGARMTQMEGTTRMEMTWMKK